MDMVVTLVGKRQEKSERINHQSNWILSTSIEYYDYYDWVL